MNDLQTLLKRAKRAPNNFPFRDLCRLAELAGFEKRRQRGTSHVLYKHAQFGALMNFQRGSGSTAKPYQVRQLIQFIEDHIELKT